VARWPIALILAALHAGPAVALDRAGAEAVLEVAGRKLGRTAAALSPDRSPHLTDEAGRWTTVGAGDLTHWTQGFFPGELWMMYEATGDRAWRDRAARFTGPLEGQQTNTATHDLGFKMYGSFGAGFRATGDPAYRAVLLRSARSLATRFHPVGGIVSCCDWNPEWKLPLVIDTMMNLELLLWAAANGGDASLREAALAHARTTARELVRGDGSTFHVADLDPASGAVRWRGTFQGASDGSTWSRGQAWALHGFTMVYRHTGAPDVLDTARAVAAYWLARVPADGVPPWDFDAGPGPRDGSAAAVGASALLELAGAVADPAEADRYREAAHRALDTLASPAYLAPDDHDALLLHGVSDFPRGRGVDVGLVYGDHYVLEAVLRVLATLPPPSHPPPANPPPANPPPANPPPSDPPPTTPPPSSPPPSDPPPVADPPPSDPAPVPAPGDPGGCGTGAGGGAAGTLAGGAIALALGAARRRHSRSSRSSGLTSSGASESSMRVAEHFGYTSGDSSTNEPIRSGPGERSATSLST
jgi:unsaturated chondroitin disaccharide hydrolase